MCVGWSGGSFPPVVILQWGCGCHGSLLARVYNPFTVSTSWPAVFSCWTDFQMFLWYWPPTGELSACMCPSHVMDEKPVHHLFGWWIFPDRYWFFIDCLIDSWSVKKKIGLHTFLCRLAAAWGRAVTTVRQWKWMKWFWTALCFLSQRNNLPSLPEWC